LSFGLALPTGAESVAEYLDVDLVSEVPTDPADPATAELVDSLTAALPEGIAVQALASCGQGAGSLQESVTSTTWQMWSGEFDASAIDEAAARLLAADVIEIERERKGKVSVDDVRPLILDLHRDGHDLVADLATVGRALRPAELAAVAFPGIDALGVRVLRTAQWITHDGERREVLSLPADVSAPGEVPSA
jgi:radical SAM-linked protein